MTLEKRINSFVLLGEFLNQFINDSSMDSLSSLNKIHHADFLTLIENQKARNGWFTKENVMSAINGITINLTKEELNNWVGAYQLKGDSNLTIGVIMAGNIPLVGFHDFLTVLISGNNIQAKLASDDDSLLPKLASILVDIEPAFKSKINFVDKLANFNAVIATGSNNTARYFDYYFGKYPNIIRKNRNSVAIISNKDNKSDLNNLGKDIFQYFGLGCRNVSKIYIPKNYKLDQFFEAIFDDYQTITNNNKYANNYDYNKAVYLLGENKLLDNGFLLLKEEEALTSPVGVMNYEFYDDLAALETNLENRKEEIQCVVSAEHTPINSFKFGEAQSPNLADYADGIDTLQFLVDLA